MRLSDTNRTGLTSIGLLGNIVVAGVIFGSLSPWWLCAGIPLVLSGFGNEMRKS